MYNPVGVSKLSENQKSRLRNGHPVRIKKGTANKLHLTKEQIKKLESASRRGAGYTVTLNPEQAEKHGAGLFGDIATKVKKLANKHKDLINPIIKAVKNAGHKGLQKATSSLHGKINSIPELSGEGVKRRRGRPKKGSGLLGDVLGMINPTIGVVAKTVGLGVKKTRKPRTRKGDGILGNIANMAKLHIVNSTMGSGAKRRPKKGKGVVSDLAKSGLKALAPVLIDAASNAAKNKISGMGAKKKRTTKKTTKRGRPRKTRTGAALMPAGY
jgi:hypothetical protein